MANNTSIYGSGSTSAGNVSSSNYTTLYSGGGANVPAGDNVIITGTLTVNGCSILTDCNAFSLLPFNATTVNAFNAATAVSIGGATGVTTIQNQLSTGNYLFPLADGTADQILATDGNGVLYWADVQSLDTNYTIDATATTGGANFNLQGSDSTTDTIKFANGSGISVVRTDANTITITNTDPGSATVTSITGTANQVIASAATGAVTLSTPQDIATTSNPVFAGVTAGNITVGVSTDNTIATTTGDLDIGPATGQLNINAIVNIAADYLNLNSDNSPFNSAMRFGGSAEIIRQYTTDSFEITKNTQVDGVVTSTGLNVDNGVLYVNPTTNRVGINNTNPEFELHIDQGLDGLTQLGMSTTDRTALFTINDGDDLFSLSYGFPAGNNRLQFSPTDQWFNTGKLGVGTNTPTVALDVSGSGLFSSDVKVTRSLTILGSTSGQTSLSQVDGAASVTYYLPTAQGAAATVLTNDGSGNLTWALPGGGGSTFGNITIAVDTDNTISTTTGDLLLTSATGDVSVSSKLGINTTTPGQELTISDAGDGYVQLGMENAERLWLVSNNAGDNLISYAVQETGGSPVNRLQFDATGGNQWFNSGKLGVANSAPTEALDVTGNGVFSGDVAVNGGDITTTATTATIFTTNANNITIGGAGTNNSVTDYINLGVYNKTYAVYVDTLLTQRGITTKASSQYLNQTTTSPILIMSTTRTSMKGVVTVTDDVTGAIHTVELLANRKGLAGAALITIYGEVYSDSPLATFTVVNNGSSGLELYATLASTNSTDIYITRDSLGAVI